MLLHPQSPHEGAQEAIKRLAMPLRVMQKESSDKDVEGNGPPHQTQVNSTPTSCQMKWLQDEEGRGLTDQPLPPLKN